MQGDITLTESSSERVKAGISTPITYYYTAAMSHQGELEYINIFQRLNDKYSGRILQPEFFVVAEQSNRIFALNRKLIEEAIAQARKKPIYRFVVALSTKWFEKENMIEDIKTLLSCAPENIVFSVTATSLANISPSGKEALTKAIMDYSLKLLLDNPEEEKLSVLFDYKLAYIRLDGRYYASGSSVKSAYLRIYADYARSQSIRVVVQNVQTDDEKNFFYKAGLSLMEGKIICSPKTKVNAIISPYEMKNSN